MAEYKRIFAALDGASTQEMVMRKTIDMAAASGAEILFGHAIDSAPYETALIDFEALCEDTKSRLEEDLADLFAEARGNAAIPEVEFKVAIGRVSDVIVGEFIENYKPDLVVCGLRGLSNLKYALVGSVSKQIIREVDCDVLVVKH